MPTHADKTRLIIDTDTASDDAVALLMALEHPDFTVDALTTVSGNVPVQQASVNALYTLEIAGTDIPVYQGCERPLEREPKHAQWFHGGDGMGDMNYPPPVNQVQSKHAVEALINRFSAEPNEITLVTLGPLTNIATALKEEPRLASWVKHCFIMGGAACTVGNVTPAAEYNIWCDPEAARTVFHSGMRITMIGWELSRGTANLSDAEIQDIYALGTNMSRFAMDCNQFALRAVREIQGEAGLALADPVAMAIVLDANCCTDRSSHFVDIACQDPLTRGMTVVDQLNVTSNPPNVEVCWSLNAARWKSLLRSTLSE